MVCFVQYVKFWMCVYACVYIHNEQYVEIVYIYIYLSVLFVDKKGALYEIINSSSSKLYICICMLTD